MRFILLSILFPLALHSQTNVKIKNHSFFIPEQMIYGDTCNMSMHGFFHCNNITTYYIDIRNDSLYHYTVQRLAERYIEYRYVSIEKLALMDIDTMVCTKYFDKDFPKYWSLDIVIKKKKRKIIDNIYWNDGKNKNKRERNWHQYIKSWDPALLDKIKLAVKNLPPKL